MTIQSQILATLFDDKTIAVLQLLLKKKDIFYLRDLSRESKVSLATTYRIIQKTIKIGLVEKTLQEKFTFYRIKRNSEAFQQLYELLVGKPEDIIAGLRKEISPAKLFLTKSDKSKVIIIGEDLHPKELSEKINQTFQELAINPKILFLSPSQFNEMKSMGMLNELV